MSSPEEAPGWTRPEYWGGACVDAPSTFEVVKRPAGPFRHVQDAAGFVLATGLEAVLRGDYEQSNAVAWGGFDPEATELEDGSIVLLERERLTRENRYEGWAKPVDEQIGDLPEDIAEFAEYWRRSSMERPPISHMDFRSFGTKGQELSYQRSLQWGVVVTHLGRKVVFTWDPYDFDHATDIRDGVVRFSPDKHDLSVLPAPISLGKAEATRKGLKNVVIPRSLERTTGVQLIDADGTADFRQAVDNADILATLEHRLSNQAIFLARSAELAVAGFLSSQA